MERAVTSAVVGAAEAEVMTATAVLVECLVAAVAAEELLEQAAEAR